MLGLKFGTKFGIFFFLFLYFDWHVLGNDKSISMGSLCELNIYVLWSISEIRVRLVPPNMSKPSSNFLTDYSKAMLLLWILFVFHVCLCHAIFSVSCSLVVVCWERADPLALLCVMFSCVLSLVHMVSWVRCGTKKCDQLTETWRAIQSTIIYCQIRLVYSKLGIIDAL